MRLYETDRIWGKWEPHFVEHMDFYRDGCTVLNEHVERRRCLNLPEGADDYYEYRLPDEGDE